MARRYSSAELMDAILDLSNATANGFSRVDTRFEKLEHSINKRFDSVDLRFDSFERRLKLLEN
jgi:hypothetical protein